MSTALISPFNTPSQFLARERIETSINLPRLFAAIDADPGIVGAGVVYIDSDFNVITLREFRPICSVSVKRVILKETRPKTSPDQFIKKIQSDPRESHVVFEATNAALSCTGAVLSWVVIVSGTIAVPFTAGTSAVAAGIAYTAATAASAQCVIGAVRTYSEVRRPGINDYLDSAEWFQIVSTVLDGLSLAGVGSSAVTTLRLLRMVKVGTGKTFLSALKGLSRQERKALTAELLRMQDPRLTPKLLKLKQAEGALAKRFTPTQLRHATITTIKDSLNASLGVVGSAVSGNIHIAVGSFEEKD